MNNFIQSVDSLNSLELDQKYKKLLHSETSFLSTNLNRSVRSMRNQNVLNFFETSVNAAYNIDVLLNKSSQLISRIDSLKELVINSKDFINQSLKDLELIQSTSSTNGKQRSYSWPASKSLESKINHIDRKTGLKYNGPSMFFNNESCSMENARESIEIELNTIESTLVSPGTYVLESIVNRQNSSYSLRAGSNSSMKLMSMVLNIKLPSISLINTIGFSLDEGSMDLNSIEMSYEFNGNLIPISTTILRSPGSSHLFFTFNPILASSIQLLIEAKPYDKVELVKNRTSLLDNLLIENPDTSISSYLKQLNIEVKNEIIESNYYEYFFNLKKIRIALDTYDNVGYLHVEKDLEPLSSFRINEGNSSPVVDQVALLKFYRDNVLVDSVECSVPNRLQITESIISTNVKFNSLFFRTSLPVNIRKTIGYAGPTAVLFSRDNITWHSAVDPTWPSPSFLYLRAVNYNPNSNYYISYSVPDNVYPKVTSITNTFLDYRKICSLGQGATVLIDNEKLPAYDRILMSIDVNAYINNENYAPRIGTINLEVNHI